MNNGLAKETPIFQEPFNQTILRKVTATPAITIKNLNVRIGDNHILNDVNLTIPEKSITCIIGPSG